MRQQKKIICKLFGGKLKITQRAKNIFEQKYNRLLAGKKIALAMQNMTLLQSQFYLLVLLLILIGAPTTNISLLYHHDDPTKYNMLVVQNCRV